MNLLNPTPQAWIDQARATDGPSLRPVVSLGAQHLMVCDGEWGWRETAEYVSSEIARRHGAQVRDPLKESGIFKGFCKRWPSQAPAIVRYAFGVCDGVWMDQPITINRFCKGSDPYFSEVIAARLRG